MDQSTVLIVNGVKSYESTGDHAEVFLAELLALPRTDLFAKSVVRYLFNKKLWKFEIPEAKNVLDHLFGVGSETSFNPTEYVAATREIIAQHFGYDIPDPAPQPAFVPRTEDKKPVKKKGRDKGHTWSTDKRNEATLDGGESGSRQFKSLADHDDDSVGVRGQGQVSTAGASDRIKRAIKVQRGG